MDSTITDYLTKTASPAITHARNASQAIPAQLAVLQTTGTQLYPQPTAHALKDTLMILRHYAKNVMISATLALTQQAVLPAHFWITDI